MPPNSSNRINRRSALARFASLALAGQAAGCASWPRSRIRLATFNADITVPIGHGMMGGAWLSKSIADPLEAHGFVLLGNEAPVVFVSLDWCELRNDAYFRWQTLLAEAAQTVPERVMITTVHQHDAPIADLTAEKILRSRNLQGTICDPEFHERALQAVARSLKNSLARSRPLTHLATGQARVHKVASNRRYLLPNGEVRFDRTSSTRNPAAIAADEGLIDPYLKTITFFSSAESLATLSFYAVHPMSYYGAGEVSADFPGIARRKRQVQGINQIYCSGCSGNVTAGKYNDGSPGNRPVLAERIFDAMARSDHLTEPQSFSSFHFRSEPLLLEPRNDSGFTLPELERKLASSTKPFDQCLAALALSWRQRLTQRPAISLPLLELGPARILLLPGETYVEFQLAAQQLRPDLFICVAGYGDGATGYIPTDQHFREGDTNLKDWCWVAPGSEPRLLATITRLLS